MNHHHNHQKPEPAKQSHQINALTIREVYLCIAAFIIVISIISSIIIALTRIILSTIHPKPRLVQCQAWDTTNHRRCRIFTHIDDVAPSMTDRWLCPTHQVPEQRRWGSAGGWRVDRDYGDDDEEEEEEQDSTATDQIQDWSYGSNEGDENMGPAAGAD